MEAWAGEPGLADLVAVSLDGVEGHRAERDAPGVSPVRKEDASGRRKLWSEDQKVGADKVSMQNLEKA